MSPQPPRKSKGLLGWIGRQVGYVKGAIDADVEKLPKVVYRATDVRQQPHPADPGVTLRRTTIDEVIVINDPGRQFPKPPMTGNGPRTTDH